MTSERGMTSARDQSPESKVVSTSFLNYFPPSRTKTEGAIRDFSLDWNFSSTRTLNQTLVNPFDVRRKAKDKKFARACRRGREKQAQEWWTDRSQIKCKCLHAIFVLDKIFPEG